LDFLVDNAEKFNGYILYAHCGGRFDLNLLIRDQLAQRDDVYVVKATELNGSWLSMTIRIRKDKKAHSIEFRDSYRIFLSPLKDVTRDLCKKNFKTHLEHSIINMIAQHTISD